MISYPIVLKLVLITTSQRCMCLIKHHRAPTYCTYTGIGKHGVEQNGERFVLPSLPSLGKIRARCCEATVSVAMLQFLHVRKRRLQIETL